jgi:hypothetical protein
VSGRVGARPQLSDALIVSRSMMPRRARSVAVGLFIGLVAVVLVGSAEAIDTATPRAPVVLRLAFRRVFNGWVNGHCGNAEVANHEFALFSFSPEPTQRCASGFLLFDDQTGKRALIRSIPPSCNPRAFGARVDAFGTPWVMFFCGNDDELYNVVTRTWRPLGYCAGCAGDVVREALGARWLEIDLQLPGSCGDGHFSCGPVRPIFFNLQTRKLRHSWQKSRTTVLDLDSPTLVRHLCTPLRTPANGSLTMDGQFAVVTAGSGSYLQRCGSHRQTPLLPGAAIAPGEGLLANAHGVLWRVLDSQGVWHGQLAGVSPDASPFHGDSPACDHSLRRRNNAGHCQAVGAWR